MQPTPFYKDGSPKPTKKCINCGKDFWSKHNIVVTCGNECGSIVKGLHRRLEIKWVEKWDTATKAGLSTPCHECTSHYLNESGYPKIRRNKELTTLHRFLYEEKNGILEKGIQLRHKCDNRLCINLDHCETGTAKDNWNDMKERGRNSEPPRTGPKLTLKEVQEIRYLFNMGFNSTHIKQFFPVSVNQLLRIKNNKRWVV